MMNRKQKALLEILAEEVLEDIFLVGETTACAVIYEVINGVKTYTDYELAETDPNEYRKDLNAKQRKEYDKVDKTGLEIVNIVFNNEQIDLMSLKDFLYLIIEALYPNNSIESIAMIVNLNIKRVSPHALSQSLGISHQSIYQIMKNQIPMPKKRKDEIAEILKFSPTEYDRQKQYPVFNLN